MALRPKKELHESVYSNFDHTFNREVAERLEKGDCFARHAAYDFNGSVWFNPVSGLWAEEIWVYQKVVETLTARTLEDLIKLANNQYGTR
jgi:hypothetical protein